MVPLLVALAATVLRVIVGAVSAPAKVIPAVVLPDDRLPPLLVRVKLPPAPDMFKLTAPFSTLSSATLPEPPVFAEMVTALPDAELPKTMEPPPMLPVIELKEIEGLFNAIALPV